MPPYHILHLLETSLVDGIGVAKIVSALVDRLDPQEFKLHAWFRRGHGPLVAMLEKKGVPVQVIDWIGGERNPVGMWRFLRAISRKDFSLVHHHVGGRSVRWMSRYFGRTRVIAHLHGRVLEENWKIPAHANVDGSDLVIATSAAVAKWSGVEAQVIYPGVDVPTPEIRTDSGHNSGGHVLGTAGRLVPIKGLECLIRALPLIRAAVPDVELEIAGSGPEEGTLRSEVKRLGLNDCVRYLGWQTDIPFQRWNVFVMPSLEEAFGIAALEAMAAGLPVVASAVGGLPELVEDGKSGWLVPPADPNALAIRLVSLLQNGREQKEMGLAARARAGGFSAKRMCDNIERLYRTLLSGTIDQDATDKSTYVNSGRGY